MGKIKDKIKWNKINLENVLCLFILMCPVLDMISFLYRNIFGTNFSPSTITRPLIPIVAIIYLFFKKDKKFKLYTFFAGLAYAVYGLIHLLLFSQIVTKSSYSTVLHEAQYIINYSFMILNLFLYIHIFRKNNNTEKLEKCVLWANLIYIVSIFISIITNTSSSTYIEKMGYKGWFESGNSIGAILILSLFICIKFIKHKKYQKIAIPIVILDGIFLTMLLGTRVGLIGFLFVIFTYIVVNIISSLINKNKINKKFIASGIIGICAVIILVITVGSATIQRRQHLKDIEKNIVDEQQNQESHITGSLLEIKEKIDNNTLEEGYLSDAQKQSIIDLYNIANKIGIKNNDQRMQQLIYNVMLVKNQKSPLLILFGNGYMANYRELVLEMEIPAFLFNFGIIGFSLYFIPFLAIFIYAIYKGFKNRKKIDSEYLMLIVGSGFVFALSFFAGYTFFHSSNMMIIIVLNTLLLNKVYKFK